MGPCAGAGALKIAADGFSCSTPNPNPKGKAVRPSFGGGEAAKKCSASWNYAEKTRLGSESGIKLKTAPLTARFFVISEEAFFIGPLMVAGNAQASGCFLRQFFPRENLAAPTGFEPVISALRGQRPNR